MLDAYQINKDDIKMYKKRRRYIIYNLNKGRTPRDDTLKKYNIKKDDNGLYK